MEAEAAEVNGAGTTENEASRGRERAKTPQKTKVRFDLNEEQKMTTERRSSSVETYTRKTTVTSAKPPTPQSASTGSSERPRRPASKANEPTAKWRTASAERPATMSPNTERTLQEIGKLLISLMGLIFSSLVAGLALKSPKTHILP